MIYYYRAGQIRKLKNGVDIKKYETRHPDALRISKPPSIKTLEQWDNKEYCKALDGCHVEPDGKCPHDLPSWLIAMGLI